ncbi:hypothetical protein SAMD00019534_076870 [Acytostelium subglobosum LB1]|uniref:hypothetical protein n=1 Tax=Acytostelium subglobosum LB1 TaxID=1410327 RepID=UPI000644DFAE|nr:hypothetical protein SAMD00019534_076870 [Acytostelium subglobosum LB1]GAM24512.1 hypothetical protein SAMD00019534_076870 [Acytostelium subglobosum LB1]|eukprot:XP_012752838.1 hypothetical protein SAMD00019534_076870 [Acytostelium subglobosum LB1]
MTSSQKMSNSGNSVQLPLSVSNGNLTTLIPQSMIKQYDQEVIHMFERNSPEEMKNIESSTRYEIEDKKRQLRRLIGNKYRDLVEGSDSIVKMKKSCMTITEKIGNMQSSLKSFSERRLKHSSLHSNITNNNTGNTDTDTDTDSTSADEDSIIAISRHAKFLIEITERIWRAIDHNEFYEAVVQFLKARHLYMLMTADSQPQTIKRLIITMPLVETQWLTIQQFPAKTTLSAKDYMKKANLSIEQYIGCLSTLVLFDNMTLDNVMQEFLKLRSSLLGGIIQHGTSQKQPVRITVQRMVDSIKTTLLFVLLMFYPTSSSDGQQQDDSDSSTEVDNLAHLPVLTFTSSMLETTFTWSCPYMHNAIDYLDQVDKGKGDRNRWERENNETARVDKRSSTQTTHSSGKAKQSSALHLHVSEQAIHKLTLEWLDQVVQTIRARSNELFAPVTNAKELSRLRAEVFEELATFRSVVDKFGDTSTTATSTATWNNVIKRVVGVDTPCIIDVFEEILLLKSEQIIETAFSSINLTSLLQSKLQQTKAEDKDYSDYLWAYHDDATQSIKNKTNGITPQMDLFLQQVGQMYSGCISDFLDLFPASSGTAAAAAKEAGNLISPTQSRVASSRLLSKRQQQSQEQSIVEKYELKENELRQFMRKSFHNSIRQFCTNNQSTVAALATSAINSLVGSGIGSSGGVSSSKASSSSSASSNIQDILFIAKTSKLLYRHIQQQPQLYFVASASESTGATSPTSNRHNSHSSNSNNNNSTNNSGHETLILQLVDELKEVHYIGFIAWVEYITTLHCQSLKQRMNSDTMVWEHAQQLTRSWERHTIPGVEQQPDAQVLTPYQPSAYILSLLFDISLENNKISINTLDKNIQQYIALTLTNKVYKVVQSYLALKTTSSFTPICKEGYLQLYVDFKYLGCILYGNKKAQPIKDPVFNKAKALYDRSIVSSSSSSSTDTTTPSASNRTFQDILSLIEEKIDTVDMILYKDFINRFVESTYSKTSTMFGYFTKSHRSIIKQDQQQSRPKSATNEQPSTMPLARCNAKFQLFSIESIPNQTPPATPEMRRAVNSGAGSGMMKPSPMSSSTTSPSLGRANATGTNATAAPSGSGSTGSNNNASKSSSYSLMEQMSKKIQQQLTNIGK